MTAFRDWLNTVFGSDGGRAMQMILALLVVVGLLLTLAWLFRRVFGAGLAGGKGGRLAVIDAAHVDGRRRLVLLRRDDVEHLVMIGGPNDLLVESRILRGAPVLSGHPGRPAPRPTQHPPETETARAVVAEDPAPRAVAGPRPGMAAIGAALAGAGAFVRARTARGGEGHTPPSAAPVADHRSADITFDAPLGTPDEPVVAPRPVPASVAPSRVETPPPPAPSPIPQRQPIAPPPSPPSFVTRAEPPRPEPTPAVEIEPARFEAPVQRPLPPMPTSRPQPAAPLPPPVVAAPVVQAMVADPQERIGAELERALADLGFADEPEPVRPPQPPIAPAEPAPIDIDLQSELALVMTEHLREESIHDPVAEKIEPLFEAEPAPRHDEPVIARPAAPVAPTDSVHFEQSFGEALFARHDEPEDVAPPVSIPVPPAAPVAAPEVVPEPAPAKSPVDELEEEMARLLSEISGPMRR